VQGAPGRCCSADPLSHGQGANPSNDFNGFPDGIQWN